jgi:hypothetical protein
MHVQVLAPLAIGFTVFLVHLATIPITGTGINPARSFASAAILNKPQAWHQHVCIGRRLCTYKYICTYVCIHVCTYNYLCMYNYLCVCVLCSVFILSFCMYIMLPFSNLQIK